MSFFAWKETYSVGIAELDKQHQGLVNLINQLYDAMHAGKASAEIGNIITEMVKYSQTHFQTEEKLMTQYGYSGLPFQKAEHMTFTARAKDYQQKINSGQMVLSMDVMNFLKDWLTNHILVSDMKYSDFFKMKGAK